MIVKGTQPQVGYGYAVKVVFNNMIIFINSCQFIDDDRLLSILNDHKTIIDRELEIKKLIDEFTNIIVRKKY